MRAWLVSIAFTAVVAVRPSCSAKCTRRSFTAAAIVAAPTAAAHAARAPPPPFPVQNRDGAEVKTASWLSGHVTDDPDLVLGLDGEPHFLLTSTSEDGSRAVRPYALRAECTHLGCLVQPDPLTGGFACPCHGSRCEELSPRTRSSSRFHPLL